MANLLNSFPTNIAEYPNSFKRQGAFPLDAFSVFYSLEEAQAYASVQGDAAYGYVGQTLAVVTANAADSSVVDNVAFYIIADTAGTLQEIGSQYVIDNASLIVKNGKLQLAGFDTASIDTVPQKKRDAEGNDYLAWVPMTGGGIVDLPDYSISKETREDAVVYKLLKNDEAVLGEEIIVPIATNDSTDSTIADRLDDFEEALSGYETRISDIEDFFTNEELDDTIDTLKEIREFLTGEDGTVATLLTDVSAVKTTIATLTEGMEEPDSIINLIEEAISNNDFSEDLSAIQEQLKTFATTADINTAIEAVLGEDFNPESGITLSSLDTKVNTLDTTITALIGESEGTIEQIATQVATQVVNDAFDFEQLSAAIDTIYALDIANDEKEGLVKTSSEIGVNTEGSMYIKRVSTDTLTQGTNTLVLNGGNAQ